METVQKAGEKVSFYLGQVFFLFKVWCEQNIHVGREKEVSVENKRYYLKRKAILWEAGSLYSCLAFGSEESKLEWMP